MTFGPIRLVDLRFNVSSEGLHDLLNMLSYRFFANVQFLRKTVFSHRDYESELHLVLEVHGVLVDDPLPHVVEPVCLDPVEGLRLVRAEVEGDLGQAGAGKARTTLGIAEALASASMACRTTRSRSCM